MQKSIFTSTNNIYYVHVHIKQSEYFYLSIINMQSGLGLKLIETSQLCNLYKKTKKNKRM